MAVKRIINIVGKLVTGGGTFASTEFFLETSQSDGESTLVIKKDPSSGAPLHIEVKVRDLLEGLSVLAPQARDISTSALGNSLCYIDD